MLPYLVFFFRYHSSGKGSFLSLTRRSLKGSSSKKPVPVIIRAVLPSSPAALTEELSPGKRERGRGRGRERSTFIVGTVVCEVYVII